VSGLLGRPAHFAVRIRQIILADTPTSLARLRAFRRSLRPEACRLPRRPRSPIGRDRRRTHCRGAPDADAERLPHGFVIGEVDNLTALSLQVCSLGIVGGTDDGNVRTAARRLISA
jgi:hypothetical protein